MVRRFRKMWSSSFAKKLLDTEKTSTVEEAVEQRVKRIHQTLNTLGALKPGINLDYVASVCNIRTPVQYVKMDQHARLLWYNGHFFIQVNENQQRSIRRCRFSIAHEIAHKILASGEIAYCEGIGYIDDSDEEEEWLCDYAAKQILMLGAEYIQPIILKHEAISFYTIQNIYVDYKVSFESAIRAVVDSTLEIVAVIYFDNQLRIARYYHSEQFPRWISIRKLTQSSKIVLKTLSRKIPQNEVREVELNSKTIHFDIQTLPRKIWVKGKSLDGVIAIFSKFRIY